MSEGAQRPPRRVGLADAVVVGVAAATGWLWWAMLAPRVWYDTGTFLETAWRWRALDFRGATAARAPLYPILLALTGAGGDPDPTTTAVQVGLGVVTTWLVFRLLAPRCGRTVAAVIATAAMLALPIRWYLTIEYSETLATTLLVATVWAADAAIRRPSMWRWVGAGTTAGLALLVRPEYAVLVPVVAVGAGVACRRRHGGAGGWRTAAAVAVPASLLLAALIGFNAATAGYVGPTSYTGYNLMNHAGAFVDDAPPQYREFVTIFVPYRDAMLAKDHSSAQAIHYAAPELRAKLHLNFTQLGERLTSLAVTQIERHPVAYARSVAGAWVRFWTVDVPYASEDVRRPVWRGSLHALAALQWWLVPLLVAAFAASVLAIAMRVAVVDWTVRIAAAMVVCASISVALVENGANARFASPYQVLMVVVVAATGAALVRRLRPAAATTTGATSGAVAASGADGGEDPLRIPAEDAADPALVPSGVEHPLHEHG